MSVSAINRAKLDDLVTEVRHKLRAIIYDRQNWYVGTDACRVLGLAPSPSRKSYQSVFHHLCEQERMTLPETFGGRGHERVMVNRDGLYTLAWVALERQAIAEARGSRVKRQEQLNERQTNVQAG